MRLSEKGLARFEVLAPAADRELVRDVARRLAEDTPKADEIRRILRNTVGNQTAKKGGILEALRRSPLVGAELELIRPTIGAREIDL